MHLNKHHAFALFEQKSIFDKLFIRSGLKSNAMRCLVIFFLPLIGFSQNQTKPDSLKIALLHRQNYTQKTQIIHLLIDSYTRTQPDLRIQSNKLENKHVVQAVRKG